jgi:hypothetical protein
MSDRRFLNAHLIAARTNVLGRILLPFCIKHRIWLEGIGSPFLEADKEITPADLLIGLKVCAEEPFGNPTWADRWLMLRLTLDRKLFAEGCRAFVAHIDTHKDWPKFYEKKDSARGGQGTVPWQMSVVAALCKNGISYPEAMQMPEAKAIWLAAVFAIQGGAKMDILSTDDEELIDSLDKPGAVDGAATVGESPKPNEQ